MAYHYVQHKKYKLSHSVNKGPVFIVVFSLCCAFVFCYFESEHDTNYYLNILIQFKNILIHLNILMQAKNTLMHLNILIQPKNILINLNIPIKPNTT